MSEMKYCQGPKCHEYHTKDRIRGSKGDKHYETRKRSSFYYMNGNDVFFYWDINAEPNKNGNQWRQATNPTSVKV